MSLLGRCVRCNKNTYALEGVTVGPPSKTQVFHKTCFKCQNDGCNWQLTLTNYKFFEDRVYCKNHCPMTGQSVSSAGVYWKAHGTTDTSSIQMSTPMHAPKGDTVNEQLRGPRIECTSCGSKSVGGNFCSSCGSRLRA